MKKQIVFCSLAALLGLGLASPLMRGAPRKGSLSGEVADPSGAAVPGATVMVSNGTWSEALSTDGYGHYVAGGLAPGRYEVSVSSDGFAPLDRTGLVVSAGRRTEMDAMLGLAVLRQEITVTAAASPNGLSRLNGDAGAGQ
jgi:hypothetical protein